MTKCWFTDIQINTFTIARHDSKKKNEKDIYILTTELQYSLPTLREVFSVIFRTKQNKKC